MSRVAEQFIQDVIESLGCRNSLSGLRSELMYKGWKLPSKTVDFEELLERNGFKIDYTYVGKKLTRIVTFGENETNQIESLGR